MRADQDFIEEPKQASVQRTVALAAALMMGRESLYADELTDRHRVRLVALSLVQLAVLIYAAVKFSHFTAWVGVPAICQAVLTAWCIGSSLAVWWAHTRRVFGRFKLARRTARLVPLRMREDGAHEHVPPPQEDFAQHRESYLRLGVSRRWSDSAFRYSAPHLIQRREENGVDEGFAEWVRLTQVWFEPRILLQLALLSLLTLNVLWPAYFLFASTCLAASARDEQQWFFFVGHRRFLDALDDLRTMHEQRKEAEARDRAAAQRRFLVRDLSNSHPDVPADDPYAHLSAELRNMMEAPPTPDRPAP